MYKNFIITESEREEILNQHKDKGYKQPLNENQTSKIAHQAKVATEMLSPEEQEFLKNYIEMNGEKHLMSLVKHEIHGMKSEVSEEDENISGTEMSDKEYNVRTILDKIINRVGGLAMIGTVPAAMFISGGVGAALGVTALAAMTLKDSAWWGKKGHHYKESDKSRKDWYNK
jgi:hypothetical protein